MTKLDRHLCRSNLSIFGGVRRDYDHAKYRLLLSGRHCHLVPGWHCLVMKKASQSANYRFPPDVISTAVWLYHRFSLSFRDVEDLMAHRGVTASYESVRRWCLKFGPGNQRALKRRDAKGSDRWHVDEAF